MMCHCGLLQEDLFKFYGMPPPLALKHFVDTMRCVTPQKPGSEVQVAADDNKPDITTDNEFSSDDEDESADARRQLAAQEQARSERRQRRTGISLKSGHGSSRVGPSNNKASASDAQEQRVPGVPEETEIAATTEICNAVSLPSPQA